MKIILVSNNDSGYLGINGLPNIRNKNRETLILQLLCREKEWVGGGGGRHWFPRRWDNYWISSLHPLASICGCIKNWYPSSYPHSCPQVL